MRRPRIRFVGNGRLVRNAVGSRYYLMSLSASYLTTIGKTGANRTHASLIWSQSVLPIIRRPHIGAPDWNRTSTAQCQRILSPSRLPIPPRAHKIGVIYETRTHTTCLEGRYATITPISHIRENSRVATTLQNPSDRFSLYGHPLFSVSSLYTTAYTYSAAVLYVANM